MYTKRRRYATIRARLLVMLQASPMLYGQMQQGRIDEDWALQLFAGSRLRLNQEDSKMPGPKQMWEATDGGIFATEEEYNAHEAMLAQSLEFDEFIASVPDRPRGASTRIKNVLQEYAVWKANRA